ncbi:DJ-1/PfpI family protein [Xenorhabdus sp. PB61.4]|uniref:DJ-1/PfpI family protein n=1 Tax=Xenorhabdus sp. PB61.4 TaxID=2788940 RepID=UPI001E3BE479|nr:DJ-1/PfpI family protein [Xenorhabdus sp. PB61.4]MCC8368398.1 DJ-1/PfpI family protein [Xenorhabdus sp. PB61.4]
MYTIAIVIFDEFTDIDYFLMRDIFGREKQNWQVKVLGTKPEHVSTLGQAVKTDGPVALANDADVVIFSSGYKGVPAALANSDFMDALQLNPQKQLIGSVCSGAFILHKLGLLDGLKVTTHPDAMGRFREMGIEPENTPIVIQGNIATAGGCLSAMYLTGWVAQRLFDDEKRRNIHRQLIPAGQELHFETLIAQTLADAYV